MKIPSKVCRLAFGLSAVLALATSAQTASAAVNLLTNGSFESVLPCNDCAILGAMNTGAIDNGIGSNNLPGWNTSAASMYAYVLTAAQANAGVNGWDNAPFALSGGVFASTDGGNFVALDQAYGGSISQDVSGLVPGHSYQLKFSMATSPQLGYPVPDTANMYWDVSVGTDLHKNSFILPVRTGLFSTWIQQSMTFVASQAAQTLSFASKGNEPGGTPPFLLLDGVSLADVTPVPEPANAALLAFGMSALVGLSLHRRRRAD